MRPFNRTFLSFVMSWIFKYFTFTVDVNDLTLWDLFQFMMIFRYFWRVGDIKNDKWHIIGWRNVLLRTLLLPPNGFWPKDFLPKPSKLNNYVNLVFDRQHLTTKQQLNCQETYTIQSPFRPVIMSHLWCHSSLCCITHNFLVCFFFILNARHTTITNMNWDN